MPLPPLARTRAPAGLLAVALAAAATGYAQEPPADPPKGLRVFTAGHSFHTATGRLLGQIAPSAGIRHTVAGRQGIGGSTVTQHWELEDKTHTVKTAIREGKVDVLTLSPNMPLPDPAIDKFVALLLEHNPAGRVTVQVSWMLVDGPGNDRRKFRNADRDAADVAALRAKWAPYGDKIRAQAKAINVAYADKVGRPVIFVVPTAEAVLRLRERVAAGGVPGIAKQSDLFRDHLGHGKMPLLVMNAYCHFAVIYGRSPVGLPPPALLKEAGLGADTEKVNRILQEIAWQAVTDEPASGVAAPKPPR